MRVLKDGSGLLMHQRLAASGESDGLDADIGQFIDEAEDA